MGWVLPTSHNDPDNIWAYEATAYDNDTYSHAATEPQIEPYTWSSFLELIRSSTPCNKLRFYCLTYDYGNGSIDLDAYYDGDWHHVYQGVYTCCMWVEKELDAIHAITKIRIRLYNPDSNSRWLCIKEAHLYYYKASTVTTQAVTGVDHDSGTGNGNITVIGSANATKRGFCWNTTGNPTIADDKVEEEGNFGTGVFTGSITGLDPGIKYYVKAYAYNEAGYGYGEEVDFTTDKIAPTVTTQDVTEISQNHVKGNGNITSTGGENCSERGFQYGLTKDPTWTKKETGDYEAGAFNLTIENLQANTQYWYRAYAKNTIDPFYGYGEWVQFQTSASGTIPTGTKVSICSDNSGYTYKLNSSLLDDGKTYKSYFVLSTDLGQKQKLHINKRLQDLYSYFMKKDSGTAKIYVKCDSEAEWQYAGEISMTGDEDIIVKHLPSENVDGSGDVDFFAKHFQIKFVFENDFEFIGLITEAIPIGVS